MFGLLFNFYNFCKKKTERKITLALLGLDNAGKTTLLNTLKGEVDQDTTPTFGFNSSTLHEGKYKIEVFDLGGSKTIRSVWKKYLAEVHAIVYVVDAADPQRFEESRKTIQDVLDNQYMLDKPILIFANKQDLPTAASAAEVIKGLGMATCRNNHNVVPCTAKTPAGQPIDQRLREGLRWAVSCVDREYGRLDARVQTEAEAVRQEEARKKKERDERLKRQREERLRLQKQEEERAREVEKENALHDGKGASLLAVTANGQAEQQQAPPSGGLPSGLGHLQLHHGLALGLPHTIDSPGKLPATGHPPDLPPASDLIPAQQDQGQDSNRGLAAAAPAASSGTGAALPPLRVPPHCMGTAAAAAAKPPQPSAAAAGGAASSPPPRGSDDGGPAAATSCSPLTAGSGQSPTRTTSGGGGGQVSAAGGTGSSSAATAGVSAGGTGGGGAAEEQGWGYAQ
ncbi:hypothetical protein Agub_g12935, partial [Astrephomene gubernaculifera]